MAQETTFTTAIEGLLAPFWNADEIPLPEEKLAVPDGIHIQGCISNGMRKIRS